MSAPAPLSPSAHELLDRHAATLAAATEALAARSYYSKYPESPSPRVYGETAAADGVAAYEAHLGHRYDALADQPGDGTWVGAEVSPYGPTLGTTYPHLDVDAAVAAAQANGVAHANGAASAADAAQPLPPADSAIELAIGQPLNPRYTFAQFIAGRPNRFAHDAALGVAEQIPEARYNPLFLYGGSGLGKTHLMHAIGHEVRRRRPDLKVVYLSSERFMNGFLRALREKSTIEFKDMLRAADVLLIDDIQFLAGKEFTQEEFFHALNDLIGAGKQLVLTADRSPRALDGISERIKSRLAGGLEADLHPTDFELRFSILQARRSPRRSSQTSATWKAPSTSWR
jgi:chromosomal replication initiator protein DnaA